jgi:hypothetical protein
MTAFYFDLASLILSKSIMRRKISFFSYLHSQVEIHNHGVSAEQHLSENVVCRRVPHLVYDINQYI